MITGSGDSAASQPPPPLTIVIAAGAADPTFDTARELIAAAEAHDGTSPVSDQALIAAAQGKRSLIVFSGVAVGVIGEGEIDLVVRPDARGRGIGSAALDHLLARAPEELRAWAHGENPAAETLLTRAGFAPVRSLLRLVLDPSQLPTDGRDPDSLQPPSGFALRRFSTTRAADRDAWLRVNAAAFATHPEQGRMSAADFTLVTQEPWFDPDDLFLLASPNAELAGSTWIKTVAGDPGAPPECELYAIGIHPDHAGNGLGRFLLDVTLARMAQHKPRRVSLYVDGDNDRAVQLYLSAGFTIDSRSRQWARNESRA